MLPYGQWGEDAVARWLVHRGYFVLPAYEKVVNNKTGPRLSGPSGSYIAPDLFVFRKGEAFWVEVKRKGSFTFHRMTGRWVTGIDIRVYEHYCRLSDDGLYPVVLFFLHEDGQAKDSPPHPPTGLFAQSIDCLRRRENHRSEKDGMVYWATEADGGPLHKWAELDEIVAGRQAA